MRYSRLVVAVLLASSVSAGLGIAAPAVPAAAASGAALDSPATLIVRESLGALKAFWTPRRLSATPMLALPASPPRPQVPGSGSASGASAAAGPEPPGEKSRLWSSHRGAPASMIGQLFFRISKHSEAACTATVISAPNHDTIWTAGHCVTNGKGHWYTDFLFQPDRHGNVAPFGSFAVRRISTPKGYLDHGLPQYDMAALALVPNRGGTAQKQAGSEGWHFGGRRSDWPGVRIFGYPDSTFPPVRKVNPEALRYCSGSTGDDKALGMMEFRCNMGHGSSGGPLIWDMKHGLGYVVGNVAIGQSRSFDRWSPQLGQAALRAYDAVKRV